MKKATFILFLIIFTISCKSQNIVSLKNPDGLERSNGLYLKDINNEYALFIGTWETTWENKKITLKLEKITYNLHIYPNGDFYYKDELVGKYKIINVNTGQVIEDNTGVTNYDDIKIVSIGSGKNKILSFSFSDKDLCNLSGTIRISYDTVNPNILNYNYEYDDFWRKENCPYNDLSDIIIPLPTTFRIFNRVN